MKMDTASLTKLHSQTVNAMMDNFMIIQNKNAKIVLMDVQFVNLLTLPISKSPVLAV